MTGYKMCVLCERPMRPWGTPRSMHPGTIAHGTATKCRSCHEKGEKTDLLWLARGHKRGHIKEWPRPCSSCDRPMRQGKDSPADYLGTVAHAARGLCTTCYANERQAKKEEAA